MDFGQVIKIMILFIVGYLFFQIGRWIVFPHLKIFPYIPPTFIWTTLYSIVVYIANAIFHWILIALIIIWIIWHIIKDYMIDFPIPLKTILLNLSPFKPLENAGVFGLMDNVKGILTGGGSPKDRFFQAGSTIGDFLSASGQYILSSARDLTGGTSGKTININLSGGNTSEGAPPADNGFFTTDETRQIDQEYERCILEENIPIYPEMSRFEQLVATTKNNNYALKCRLKTFDAYKNLIEYRDFGV